jgi:hypothetical protein
VTVFRGRNIKPPPVPPDLAESLEGRVLIVLGDDVSRARCLRTGCWSCRSVRTSLPSREYCFRKEDPDFVRRAKEWGGGFIVARDNYGQGSSREHAALAPLQLGVRAVFVKGIHRIPAQPHQQRHRSHPQSTTTCTEPPRSVTVGGSRTSDGRSNTARRRPRSRLGLLGGSRDRLRFERHRTAAAPGRRADFGT